MKSSDDDHILVDLSQRYVNPITGEVIREGNYSEEAVTIRSELYAMDPFNTHVRDDDPEAFRELTSGELAADLDPDKYPKAIPALWKLLDEKKARILGSSPQ